MKKMKRNKYKIIVSSNDVTEPKGFKKIEENKFMRYFVGTNDTARDSDFIKSNLVKDFISIDDIEIIKE